MIENISMWTKNITLAVVVVSIFEMLLPNQKMKQYIKVVMGLYILFNILSPLIGKDISIDVNEIISNSQAQITTTEPVDQTSMDKRLKEIGEEELEKDISKKIENAGFIVNSCQVTLKVAEETTIEKIILKIDKVEKNIEKPKEETNAENKLVEEIQKIKKIQIGEKKEEEQQQNKNITMTEINQVKKMLMEEYEVSEKCLKIN